MAAQIKQLTLEFDVIFSNLLSDAYQQTIEDSIYPTNIRASTELVHNNCILVGSHGYPISSICNKSNNIIITCIYINLSNIINMTIQEHISHAQKSFFLSGNSNSTIYLVKPWQSNPKYAGTWKYDPKLCWNIAIRSKLAFPNLAIQSLITHNNYNHNHKYIVKIIPLYYDFMAT